MSVLLDLTPLILAAICVAEEDGTPMTATDIAFMLDIPQDEVDRSLTELVRAGSITQDGDFYRYDTTRPFTAAEADRLERLHDHLEKLQPIVKMIPMRLDS